MGSFCILNMINSRVEELWGDAQVWNFSTGWWFDPVFSTPMETCTAAAQPLLSICIYNTPPPLTYIKVSFSLFPWCFIQLWDTVRKYNKSVIISKHIPTNSSQKSLWLCLKMFSFGLAESKHFQCFGKRKRKEITFRYGCACAWEPD